jgi:hypothetical protein
VLHEAYAIQIARDWNTQDAENGSVGYVTRFSLDTAYLAKFPVRCVGDRSHEELWVPAAELEEFNQHIQGSIEIIHEFRPLTPPALH